MSALTKPDPVDHLFAEQNSVARLDQLRAAGLSHSAIAHELASDRWQLASSTVVVAHNGPPTPEQTEWSAVLTCGDHAVLCGRSSAVRHGLDGWDDDLVHVLVERGAGPPATSLPINLHESRRFSPADDVHPVRKPPMTRLERSVIDAAAWTRQARSACGLVIAAVQQRLTTPDRLLDELDRVGQVRHRPLLRAVLADVAGGAQALSEVDFGRICRRNGLPQPIRQAVRIDGHGRRRYIDVELRSRRGKKWLVEIDGAVHLIVGTYWSDQVRANELIIAGEALLRFPTVTLYTNESAVVDQLRRALDD